MCAVIQCEMFEAIQGFVLVLLVQLYHLYLNITPVNNLDDELVIIFIWIVWIGLF